VEVRPFSANSFRGFAADQWDGRSKVTSLLGVSMPAAARHFEAFRSAGVLALLSAARMRFAKLADQKLLLGRPAVVPED
jgi:hypothetical protein